MRIYMLTDLEGVAGVVSFEQQSYPNAKYLDPARRLLTGEVNAAAEGLFAAGATEILVLDGHGIGGICFEDLHPDVTLCHGAGHVLPTFTKEMLGSYDAAVMIGQHAMAGVRTGNQNHTQSSQSIDYYKLNGKAIGETAQFALMCGHFGVPLIYFSGDKDGCEEAAALIKGLPTTAVKQGLARGAQITMTAPAARAAIRRDAEAALKKHKQSPLKPLVWDGPFVLEKRFFHTDTADAAARTKGVERVDSQTVRLRSDSIFDIIYA